MSESSFDRQLGLHERFCVARTNLGFPSIVAFVAQLKPPRDASGIEEVEKRLSERIEKLGELLPLLSSYVDGAKTRTPRFARRKGWRLRASDVLSRCRDEPDLDSSHLLQREIVECTAAFDLGRAPLWRVRILESKQGAQVAVMLAVHHVICDGRGSANLLQALMADELPPLDTLTGGLGPDEYPPDSIKDLGMTPGFFFVVDLIWKNLVVTRFPKYIRSWLEEKGRWPTQEPPPPIRPIEADKRIVVLNFDQADIVAKLKAVALRHEVKTLNPLVHSACLAALCSIVGLSESLLHVGTETAVSERVVAPERHHTYCSGNFVGNPSWHGSLSENVDFWDITRAYAQYIASPQGRVDGRHALGALAYVPDSASFQSSDPRVPTQFEAFFLERMQSDRPYRESMALSNIGQIALPSSVRDVAWAQNQSPMGSPFYIDACGLTHVEGSTKVNGNVAFSLSVGYRQGSVGGGREEAFVKALRRAIVLIANDMEEKQTFGNIVRALQAFRQGRTSQQ